MIDTVLDFKSNNHMSNTISKAQLHNKPSKDYKRENATVMELTKAHNFELPQLPKRE